MLIKIIAVIAPIFFMALIGYFWSYYKQPYNAEFVSKLVMNIGCPCLILATITQANIPLAGFKQIALVTAVGLLLFAIIFRGLIYCMGDDYRTYMSSLTFANTGNMGVPICLFAFGEGALALSLTFFMITSLFHFTFGVAWASGQSPFKTLLKTPVFYATMLAVLMVLLQQKLPLALFNMLSLVGDMAIPLMLFSLGVSLHSLKIADIGSSGLYATARLLIGFVVGLLLCWWFELEGVVRGIVLIQSTMPSAVFNYLIAVTYQREPEKVAAVVVLSTVLSFIVLPALLWFVL